jgi:hypothetical protein
MVQSHRPAEKRDPRIFRAKWVLLGFLAIAAFFVIAEHRAHLSFLLITEHRGHLSQLVYYLPFLLLLACPLMHLFMHGGHGKHGSGGARQDTA